MSVQTPPPPPLPEELDRLLRRLRLPYVRGAAPEVIATAAAQRWEPAEILRVLLTEEAAGRDQATIRMRRRSSQLPAGKTLDTWQEKASTIPKATQQALRTLEWVDTRGEPLRLRPVRDREESLGRGARAPRDRPRQDSRLAHPGVPRGAPAPPPRR